MYLAKVSALGATSSADLVKARGHQFKDELTMPVVVKDGLESLKSTKDAVEALESIGVYDDILRAVNGKSMPAQAGAR